MTTMSIRDRLLWITLAVQKNVLWVILGLVVAYVVYANCMCGPVPGIDQEAAERLLLDSAP